MIGIQGRFREKFQTNDAIIDELRKQFEQN